MLGGGGGTDLPFYYENRGYGAVVSGAINKYIYITVNEKFDDKIRVSYSKTEIVDDVDFIEHPSVREALRMLDVRKGIEVVSISDIPSRGTGLGSSSTFIVGLLQALHTFKGEMVGKEELAREAVRVEREILTEPGGKQDQYCAAYGNVNYMKFLKGGEVDVLPLVPNGDRYSRIENSLLLLYLGNERDSSDIHRDQINSSEGKMDVYDSMRSLTEVAVKAIQEGDIDLLGTAMHENWILKKSLSGKITSDSIDRIYSSGLKLGAKGGKVVGAGGGGFLLLVADQERHNAILSGLGLKRIDFRFSNIGSRVIFVGD